jgi:hypothetical protein
VGLLRVMLLETKALAVLAVKVVVDCYMRVLALVKLWMVRSEDCLVE